jgi:hypothetical protein
MWGSTTSGCSLLYLRVTDPVHTVICEAQRPCSSHIWGLTTSGCSQSYVRVDDLGMLTQLYLRVNDPVHSHMWGSTTLLSHMLG